MKQTNKLNQPLERNLKGQFQKGNREGNSFTKTNQPSREAIEQSKRTRLKTLQTRKFLRDDLFKATLGKYITITDELGNKRKAHPIKYLGKVIWDALNSPKISPLKRSELGIKLIEILAPQDERLEAEDERFDSLVFKSQTGIVHTNAEKLLEESKSNSQLLRDEEKRAEEEEYKVAGNKNKKTSDKIQFKTEKQIEEKKKPTKNNLADIP